MFTCLQTRNTLSIYIGLRYTDTGGVNSRHLCYTRCLRIFPQIPTLTEWKRTKVSFHRKKERNFKSETQSRTLIWSFSQALRLFFYYLTKVLLGFLLVHLFRAWKHSFRCGILKITTFLILACSTKNKGQNHCFWACTNGKIEHSNTSDSAPGNVGEGETKPPLLFHLRSPSFPFSFLRPQAYRGFDPSLPFPVKSANITLRQSQNNNRPF